MAIYWF